MLKKKSLILLVIIICLILCTSSCFRPSPITLEELCNGELVDVDEILLRDGTTGQYKELKDKEKIKEIVSILEQAEVLLKPQEVEEVGWITSYRFFSGDRRVLSIVFGGSPGWRLSGKSIDKEKSGVYKETVKEGDFYKIGRATGLIREYLENKDWKGP